MKIKLMFSLLLIILQFNAFAQQQINVIKKPTWNIRASYDSRYGSKVDLSGNAIAMIVDVPQADFAVVTIDDKLSQKWLTELSGFPMAIGKFKNNIMVIAAADRSYFKSFSNQFKAYLLEEKTGKLISEKIIYDGSKDFVETPEFFFSENGAYFKMATRLTALKRKVHIGLPVVGFFTALKMDKDFNESQSYTVIDFNDKLEQIQKMEPDMPDGDTWKASCGDDGSFIISTVDASKGKCNVAIYLSSSPSPLKTVSIPVDAFNQEDISSITFASSKKPLINYIGIFYKNANKERSTLIARIDFNNGSFTSTKEVFDKAHIKELQKSFVPANKKFDDLHFSDAKDMNIRHISEYNNTLLVTISPKYSVSSSHGSFTSEGSVLMNGYDTQMKPLYHQFLPRAYLSRSMGEGSDVSFNQTENTLRILANQSDGGSVATMYAEMDLGSGTINKINMIPKDDIKSSYYANTESISWLNNSFVIPFVERMGIFSKKVDLQLLQLKY
ncbi:MULTISPECIES: hypothetical protein [unclassified Pedobacter]|uniref:hypothetical protein n=1 Tax=unclassified Pedobacter TaxID=2628915 RepID=UPI001423AF69|nr:MULTISPECIES: hypothetical protein [unclassified Pedobacter]NII81387.1 hypothetical protein [Pedobacter sp. SG908]NMN35392.1 hypothetical protein [Pedobacter sp. SG918]